MVTPVGAPWVATVGGHAVSSGRWAGQEYHPGGIGGQRGARPCPGARRGQGRAVRRAATTRGRATDTAQAPAIGDDGEPRARRPAAAIARTGDRIAYWATAFGVERWARVGAVALTPVLLSSAELTERAGLFATLATYVLVTALAPRNRYLRTADLIVAALVIVFAGAQVAAFLPFVLVAVAAPAAEGGPRVGAAVGTSMALLLIISLAVAVGPGEQVTSTTVSLALLLPLVGLTTAAAKQVLDDRAMRERLALQEANRLLSSLRTVAAELPGGLDATTVSAALLGEIRSLPGLRQAVVFVDEHGVQRPAAASAIPTYALNNLRVDVVRTLIAGDVQRLLIPHQLPRELLQACERSTYWIVQPIGDRQQPLGVLLAGFDDADEARAARSRLTFIAEDGALALDNVRLFDGTRSRAADAARQQVAADLHDGVAQSLAHLRMELELLAVHGNGLDRGELERLARVATTALRDLRRTIRGLDAPLGGDLAALLGRHLDDLRTGHGPALTLEVTGPTTLDPERAEDALRVAQEAISNALRHAGAQAITVSLEHDEQVTELVVEDDGDGLPTNDELRPDAIGLRSMRQRAERLAGDLTVRDRRGGGTVVALRFPSHPPSEPTSR
jgi:signal transduction histidine kinase